MRLSNDPDMNDTIAAIATPVGKGGIGIVRISGTNALKIADRIFTTASGLRPSSFKTHTTHYGTVVSKGEVIDEALLTVMLKPKTYTREDVVEINCHSGAVVLRDVCDLVLSAGARLAEPGEFTKRAFLNGRIDLAQAQAVMDIISAKTDSALKVSVEQLRGGLSRRVNVIRDKLLRMLSDIEASIDFPEDVAMPDLKELIKNNRQVDLLLKEILRNARIGKLLHDGLRVVICGSPNVGKSSLLNALIREDRSIVTPLAGTTRDTVEEVVDIKGIPARIIDTAGILEPRDLIEKKAIARSRKEIVSADLILLLFDAGREISKGDLVLCRKLKDKSVIPVINKIDLRQKIDRKKIYAFFKDPVELSAKHAKNIALLEKRIYDMAMRGASFDPQAAIVSNLRHVQLIRKAQKNIAQTAESLDNKLPLEFIAQDIRESLGYLDELLGKSFSGDLLDKIFGEFCIGK